MKLRYLIGMFVVCLLAASLAQATPILIVNGSGQLTGATGVDVEGTLYDVEFVDGTCAAVFGVCDQAFFTFTDSFSSFMASIALLEQVFIPANDPFDSDPSLTQGCSAAEQCIVVTPYDVITVDDDPIVSATAAVNYALLGIDEEVHTSFLAEIDLQSLQAFTWARWEESEVAPVPEPASLVLVAAGLAIVARRLRRQQPKE